MIRMVSLRSPGQKVAGERKERGRKDKGGMRRQKKGATYQCSRRSNRLFTPLTSPPLVQPCEKRKSSGQMAGIEEGG